MKKYITLLQMGLGCLSVFFACGGKGGDKTKKDVPSPVADESPVPKDAKVGPSIAENAPVRFRLEKDRFAYDVSFAMPVGWKRDPVWKQRQVFRFDDGSEFDYPSFSFDVTCQGSCAFDALVQAEARAPASMKDQLVRPNINTGDPEKDAVRGHLEVIKEGKHAQGQFLAVRLTFDPEILAQGPYREQLVVFCTHLAPGFPSLVLFRGQAPLKYEDKALGPMLDVCRNVSILPAILPGGASKEE